MIRVGPDGKLHTYHYVASPEQYAREVAAKKHVLDPRARAADLPQGTAGGEAVGQQASAITKDSGCDPNDIWVYDVSSCPLSGTFARVCFYGQGTEVLDNDTFLLCSGGTCFSVYWSHNVYSYWPGTEDGYFENGAWGTQVSFSGGSNTSCANTNLCNPGGDCDYLTLTN